MTRIQEKFVNKPLERQIKEYAAAIILEKYELLAHIQPVITYTPYFREKVEMYLNKNKQYKV